MYGLFDEYPFGKDTLKEVARVKRMKIKESWEEDWLCHIPADPDFTTPWTVGKEEIWQVCSPESLGFNIADEKYPYRPISRKKY